MSRLANKNILITGGNSVGTANCHNKKDQRDRSFYLSPVFCLPNTWQIDCVLVLFRARAFAIANSAT
jgi:hypothetical protein